MFLFSLKVFMATFGMNTVGDGVEQLCEMQTAVLDDCSDCVAVLVDCNASADAGHDREGYEELDRHGDGYRSSHSLLLLLLSEPELREASGCPEVQLVDMTMMKGWSRLESWQSEPF